MQAARPARYLISGSADGRRPAIEAAIRIMHCVSANRQSAQALSAF
jgi:hypothetical protein